MHTDSLARLRPQWAPIVVVVAIVMLLLYIFWR